MDVSIEKDELLVGLYLMQGIVERRTTIPILANALIQSADDGITIASTDQEISITRLCTASVKRGGMLTTGARKLYEIVRELPDGPVHLSSQDNYWIEISSGRSRYKVVGMDPREFPAMSGPPGDLSPTFIPAARLLEMIKHTIFAVSGDEARRNLNGLYFESDGRNRLRAVATDGHRLATIVRPVDGAELAAGVIIGRKAITEIQRALEGAEDTVELYFGAGVVHMRRGPVRMSMRLVEGGFPEYKRVIPAKTEYEAIVDVAPFHAALRRVVIVSSERTRGVRMSISGERMRFSSINPDLGEAEDEIEVEYHGKPLEIGFNARYLIDVLYVLPSGGRVRMAFNDDASPAVIREEGDPDYCYIVMPMRL